MDDRTLGRAVAWGRICLGAARLLAPRTVERALGGSDLDGRTDALARSVGMRDVGIGAGLLEALNRDWEIATWAAIASVADLTDMVTPVLPAKNRPRGRPLLRVALAASALSVDFFRLGRMEGKTNPYMQSETR